MIFRYSMSLRGSRSEYVTTIILEEFQAAGRIKN